MAFVLRGSSLFALLVAWLTQLVPSAGAQPGPAVADAKALRERFLSERNRR